MTSPPARRALIRRVPDAWLLLRVIIVGAVTPLLFRFPLSFVGRVLTRPEAQEGPDPRQASRIIRCVQLAQRYGRPVLRPGCLTRGTTLFYFLRRAGYSPALCFGTGFPTGEFAGHCWLELDGKPFLEGRDPGGHFREIFRIEARGAARAGATAAEKRAIS